MSLLTLTILASLGTQGPLADAPVVPLKRDVDTKMLVYQMVGEAIAAHALCDIPYPAKKIGAVMILSDMDTDDLLTDAAKEQIRIWIKRNLDDAKQFIAKSQTDIWCNVERDRMKDALTSRGKE